MVHKSGKLRLTRESVEDLIRSAPKLTVWVQNDEWVVRPFGDQLQHPVLGIGWSLAAGLRMIGVSAEELRLIFHRRRMLTEEERVEEVIALRPELEPLWSGCFAQTDYATWVALAQLVERPIEFVRRARPDTGSLGLPIFRVLPDGTFHDSRFETVGERTRLTLAEMIELHEECERDIDRQFATRRRSA